MHPLCHFVLSAFEEYAETFVAISCFWAAWVTDMEKHGVNVMGLVDVWLSPLMKDLKKGSVMQIHWWCCCTSNGGAGIGLTWKPLSHLLLTLACTLQEAEPDPVMLSRLDSVLWAVGSLMHDLGRLMAHLVHAHDQLGLAQSHLPEACKTSLSSHLFDGSLLYLSAQLLKQAGSQSDFA